MRVEFPNRHEDVLVGDLLQGNKDFCVVLCHGLAAHRQLGVIQLLFNELSGEGYSVFCFDFAGNGESGGSFSESTYLTQPRDLEDALNFLGRVYGYTRFVTIGHSMGGFAVLKEAETDSRVIGIISLAGVSRPGALLEMYRDRYPVGKTFVIPEVKGVRLPERDYEITSGWLAAARQASLEGADFHERNAATIQGVDDDRVPLSQSEWLEERGVRLVRIPGDHFFSEHYEEVLAEVRAFLRQLTVV